MIFNVRLFYYDKFINLISIIFVLIRIIFFGILLRESVLVEEIIIFLLICGKSLNDNKELKMLGLEFFGCVVVC